jgi:hypothetical protein
MSTRHRGGIGNGSAAGEDDVWWDMLVSGVSVYCLVALQQDFLSYN